MSYIDEPPPLCNFEKIVTCLRNNFKFSEIEINKKEFINFYKELDSWYPMNYKNLFDIFYAEKLFEHFVSIKLLEFNKKDVFIDIAASQSPFADYICNIYKCKAYKQDLIFENGIHYLNNSLGIVGGNASKLPFRDEYFSKMTLHCSLEHFENKEDIDFIKEAQRVLKKNGKLCILPLYFGELYHIVTDPEIYLKEKKFIDFESEVNIYKKKSFGNRHCRVYSIEKFNERMVKTNNMNLELYFISNLSDIDTNLYCNIAAIFKKK